MVRIRRLGPPVQAPSAFTGLRFHREQILLAVRWYLRYGLSHLVLEELLAERGITVDHVTLFRWVQRFAPELIDAARPGRHAVGGQVDRRRNLRQVRLHLAVRLSCGGPGPPPHRRVRLPSQGYRLRAQLLHCVPDGAW
jgi:hypothetical protein